MMGLMSRAAQSIAPRAGGGVGLYGAIEVRTISGPVFLGHDYEVAGKVLAAGETPKSEYCWYEATLSEPGGGKAVAASTIMRRVMKASSELWR